MALQTASENNVTHLSTFREFHFFSGRRNRTIFSETFSKLRSFKKKNRKAFAPDNCSQFISNINLS